MASTAATTSNAKRVNSDSGYRLLGHRRHPPLSRLGESSKSARIRLNQPAAPRSVVITIVPMHGYPCKLVIEVVLRVVTTPERAWASAKVGLRIALYACLV